MFLDKKKYFTKNKFHKIKFTNLAFLFFSIISILLFGQLKSGPLDPNLNNYTQIDSLSNDSLRNENPFIEHYIPRDTIHFKYEFKKGDSLIYRLISWDSISINWDSPLLKSRRERILITCDSVVNGRFYLCQTLVGNFTKESKEDMNNIDRPESKWVGRKVYYSIDSTGKRYNWSVDDSTIATMSPGGAFQAPLIFAFDSTYKRVGDTWNSMSLYDLPENGIPVTIMKQSSLFRMVRKVDTLDEQCVQLNFVRTGAGSNTLISEKKRMQVVSVINSHGELMISRDKHIPVHLYVTQEQKLTIKVPEKNDKQGYHYTTCYYSLEEFIRSESNEKEVKNMPEIKMSPKKKKSNKK